MPSTNLSKTVYQRLLDDIAAIYDEAMKDLGVAVDDILKKARWGMGRLIDGVQKSDDIRAQHGNSLIDNIANDLSRTGRKGFSPDNLRRMLRVYQAFPNSATSPNLTWSHYVALSSIKDDKQRKSYTTLAINKKWILEDLENALKNDNVELLHASPSEAIKRISRDRPPARLPVKRGIVGLYPVVERFVDQIPVLKFDRGFKNYQDIPENLSGKVKAGDIFKADFSGKTPAFERIKLITPSVKSTLYTFAGSIDTVIDGDTIKVMINQGFGSWADKKLRLRKINAPELDTQQGQSAKAYVEKVLRSVKRFVIKSYSTDIYDRYLVDVFYLTSCDDPEIIARDGILLNQELLDKGFADVWLTIEPDDLAFMN